MLAENWYICLAGSSGAVLAAQQIKSSKADFASLVCLAVPAALPLVVRFGRSAAQILQNGPRQLAMLGYAPCSRWWSVFVAQQPKSSKTDLASFVCLAVLLALPLVVRFGRSAAQIFQNGLRQLAMLGCALCSPSGGPLWPLSSPNPPKRTSATQILQNGPRHLSLLGCAPCSPS